MASGIDLCLDKVAKGEIDEIAAYEELIKLNLNTGLNLSYYCQKWIESEVGSDKNFSGSIWIISDKTKFNFTENIAVKISDISENIENLISELKKSDKLPDCIVIDFTCYLSDEKATKKIILYLYCIVKELIGIQKKVKIICYCEEDISIPDRCYFDAIGGFAKTQFLENSDIQIRTVSNIDKGSRKYSLEQIIANEMLDYSPVFEVRYSDKRLILEFDKAYAENDNRPITVEKNECIIVAGGMGKIGRTTVSGLLDGSSGKAVILGRSNISESEIASVFKDLNSQIEYYAVDISSREQISLLINKLKNKGYRIKGIINCAGTFHNSFIINKNPEDASGVIASKCQGTENLHFATLNEKLDFFCTYSSVAGVFGKVGQADYAYANSFLNRFCEYRTMAAKEGRCFGKTLCINWPFWLDGGMKIDEYEIRELYDSLGLTPLPDSYGQAALYRILQSESGAYTVLFGNTKIIEKKLLSVSKNIVQEIIFDNKFDDGTLFSKTVDWLKNIFSDIFGIDRKHLNEEVGFDEFGIDSVGFNRLQVKLEKNLGNMKKTLMYDTKNIGELTEYLTENKKAELYGMFYKDNTKPDIPKTEKKAAQIRKSVNTNSRNLDYIREDIAIIGMSGRFPGANSCEELWVNISNGRDSVGEIPENRWDIQKYNNGDYSNLKEGESYCRWGGYIDNAGGFDPQFFNMSPKEAQMTDPQERILLQVAYEAFEDAGYNRNRLCQIEDAKGSPQVGVYVSGASNTYNLIGVEEWTKGNYIVPNALPWSISNRISYFMNFSGPSFSVDAACAGGLIAVQQAVNALKNGECKMALAGGVNLYLHPYKYVSLSQVKMLSRTGKCYAFSNKADGFVPGESIAAILLKPVSQARIDGDRIYGVIKASAINHDGSSNGYMAPNPAAQAELIKGVIEKAGISARYINYIEAHGTGTPVGDPIEINALTKAFSETTSERQFCSIGSIKTNIGHSEGAAGIVGIIKVLLQLKYKKIVPSLYSDDISKEIDFNATPFYVQKKLDEWNSYIELIDGKEYSHSRTAGISSFGAGGANGHVIIEEYNNQAIGKNQNLYHIVPVSAKSQAQLSEYCRRLSGYLSKNSVELADLAYTMQTGRNDFMYKAAFVCKNTGEFKLCINDYIIGKENKQVLSGKSRTSKEFLEKYPVNGNSYDEIFLLVQKWLEGKRIDWDAYINSKANIISLPHYPFLEKQFWVQRVEAKNNSIQITGNDGNKQDSDRTAIKKTAERNNANVETVEALIGQDEIDIYKIKDMLGKALK
jgi:3-oxoacyl-(acyl-carrier-protein) synthase/acyl carrier protein